MPNHLDKAYAETFGSTWGQEVLADMRQAFYDTPLFAPGTDQLTLAFREGQRSVVLDILASIERGQESEPELPAQTISDEELPDAIF